MAITKPDLTRVWANGAPPANVVDPDTTTPGKFAAGWLAEVPPFEHFNFLQQLFTQGLAYNNEQGINEWDSSTVYPVGAIVKGSDGRVYSSKLEQSSNDPISDDGTNWITKEIVYFNSAEELRLSSVSPSINRIYIISYNSWVPGVTDPKGEHYRYRNGSTGAPSTISGGIIYDANGDGWEVDGDILSAASFGFPLTLGTDASVSVNAAMNQGERLTGAEIKCPSNNVSLSNTIFVTTGNHLIGGGVVESFTVNKRSTAFEHDAGASTTAVAIQLGADGDPTPKNRGERVSGIRVTGSDSDYGIAFSTVDTDNVSNTQNTINWAIEWCTAFSCLVGFRHRNAWTFELTHNHAIQCGTGFLVDGAGAGGGTSGKYIANVAYQCDIGFDLQSGWNYSGMDSCGADGCRIGINYEMRSARGSTVRNFGIERIDDSSGQGYGIYVDDGGAGAGYLTVDGLNFGVHDSVNTTFIHVEDAGRVIFRGDTIVTSGIINSCIFYTQANANADVCFEGLTLFCSTASLGDIFAENVTLINCNINGRRFLHAKGGLDDSEQRVAYTSATTYPDGISAPNKPIWSREMMADTNSAGINRFLTSNGTDPCFDTSPLPDWCYIKFTNATDTGTPAQIGFRSEDHTANTGIIRDPAISAGTTITLTNPGDWVVFQKRPDGKLYQVEMVTPPI